MGFVTVMGYIYAIIRVKGGKKLRFVQESYSVPSDISDSDLCDYFKYAGSLSEAYCSDLPKIDLKELAFSRGKRMDALGLRNATIKMRDKYDIVALSHRYGGFTHIHWNFGEDVTFHIYSNFGFGRVSDFNATFKYKDIILAPYSYYVKYKSSTYSTVVSCTYSYALEYSQWSQVMQDCLDFYNAIVFNQEIYVFNWLNDHLSKMVDGLESFLTIDSYGFYDSRENNHVSTMAYINGDDFWIIKSQKIANSLEFVENIKILPTKVNTENYIKRLITLCKTFEPKLKMKIQVVQETIDETQKELNDLEDNNQYQLYSLLKEKYYWKRNWYLGTNTFKMIWFLLHLKKHIEPKLTLSQIRKLLPPLKQRIDGVDKVCTKLSSTKSFHDSLSDSLKTMTTWMKKIKEDE